MGIPIPSHSYAAAAAWPVLADAALKSVVILVAAWAATLLMRRASAAARHLVWTLAVCATLAVPVLSGLLPAWRVLPAWLGQGAVPSTSVAGRVPDAARPVMPIDPAAAVAADPGTRAPFPVLSGGPLAGTGADHATSGSVAPPARIASPPAAAAPAVPAWQSARRPPGWQAWVAIGWACGTAVFLVPVLVSLVSLWRMGRRLAPIEGGTWARLTRDLARELGLHRRRPAVLLRGREQAMPMTWGFLRPKLLLPSEADGWPGERRRVVLMHELAHIKRADFLTQLLVQITRAIYWFNPLMWVAARQVAVESEAACDDLVLARRTRPSDYAEHLLTVAAGLRAGAILPVAAVAMARSSSSRLEGRLRAILDADRNRRAVTAAGVVLAITLLAGGVLPLAMARAADREGGAKKPATDAPVEVPNEAPKAKAAEPKAAPPAAPAGELTGAVTDEAGKPLPGVLVDVWTWHAGTEATTDEHGRFTLKKLGAAPVELRFSKDGFCPWYEPVQPTGVNLRVRLSARTYFEGEVTGPAGKPLADALVRADAGPKSNPGVHIDSVWTETRTDANGRYRLYVAPDEYDVQVRVPGVGAARLPGTVIGDGEANRLDIKLTPGVTFRAVAVDSETGAPVPNVRLSSFRHKGIEATSDGDGRLAIDGMTPGPFRFDVEAAGYARWWSPQAIHSHQRKEVRESLQRNFDHLEFDLAGGMEPVKIEMERAVRVTGVVRDPAGNPVAGATVAPALTGTGNSITGDTRFSVPTADDGTFVMTLPASGNAKYNLVAHDGKYGQWRKWANGVLPPIQTTPGDELKDVVITLTRPATVRGRATDESGKPLVGRDVRASAADRLENRYYDPTTKTDKDGNFELRFIRPGEQFIQVAPFFWTDVPPGGMTLKLKPGQTNSLAVTLKEGEVKTGVELTGPASTAFPSREEQLRRRLE